jgi:hypothetical protein
MDRTDVVSPPLSADRVSPLPRLPVILESVGIFQYPPVSQSNEFRLNILEKLSKSELSVDNLIYTVQYINSYSHEDILAIICNETPVCETADINKRMIENMLGRIYLMRKTSIFATVRPTYNGHSSTELIKIITDDAFTMYSREMTMAKL